MGGERDCATAESLINILEDKVPTFQQVAHTALVAFLSSEIKGQQKELAAVKEEEWRCRLTGGRMKKRGTERGGKGRSIQLR